MALRHPWNLRRPLQTAETFATFKTTLELFRRDPFNTFPPLFSIQSASYQFTQTKAIISLPRRDFSQHWKKGDQKDEKSLFIQQKSLRRFGGLNGSDRESMCVIHSVDVTVNVWLRGCGSRKRFHPCLSSSTIRIEITTIALSALLPDLFHSAEHRSQPQPNFFISKLFFGFFFLISCQTQKALLSDVSAETF